MTCSQPVLRLADISDIEKLVKIRLEFLVVDFGEIKEDILEKIRARLPVYYNEHLNRDFFAYIADADGEIVSTVFLLVYDKPANHKFITGKTGLILNVYTTEKYRHMGIATTLLKHAIEDSKKMNLSYIELTATEAGKPLYEKLGFVKNINEHEEMILRFD